MKCFVCNVQVRAVERQKEAQQQLQAAIEWQEKLDRAAALVRKLQLTGEAGQAQVRIACNAYAPLLLVECSKVQMQVLVTATLGASCCETSTDMHLIVLGGLIIWNHLAVP